MFLRGLAAVLLGSCAMPALAQVSTQGSATAADPADNEGGEIVVTGEKTNRTVQDTPASVAVTTSETIRNQNLFNLYDVLERTPNVAIDGNRTTFSIRGIDAFNVSGGGDGVLASVYVDGAVLPRFALNAGPLDLYDIAQVEVFRGPQSTVQGRNALAGAVIIRTTDPSYRWTGTTRLLMTDKDGQRRAAAAVGGPIVDGQVAFRLSGEIARADGLITNVTHARDADRRASETLRGKLLLTPSAIPDLRVVATYMHDRHVRGTFNVELDAPYRATDRITTEDVPDQQRVNSDIGTLEVGYDLAPGFKLSSVTNYSDVLYHSYLDPDRTAAGTGVSRVRDPDKTFQQELRLNLDLPWVRGVVGAYYLRDDDRGYFFQATQSLNLTRLGVDQRLLALGLSQATVDRVVALYGGVVPIQNSLRQPRLTKNLAGFTDLTFPLLKRLQLRAGLRYDHESQNRGATQTVVIAQALPDPAALPIPALAPIVTQLNGLLQSIADGANSDEPVRKITYHALLPKAGLTYEVTDDLSLSATAQRGYRAGGSGLNQQRAQAYDYSPEHTWNYELALRSEWLDHRLTINANAYWIDWTDQQVSVQLTPGAVFDTQVVNAGKSRLYGFEVEVRGRPTRALSLYGGIGYSRTRFEDFAVTVGQLSASAEGNEFTQAPRWTASAGGTWQGAGGLFANVNANYRSGFYQDTVVQTRRDIRGRTFVNAKLGWQGEHLGVFLIANNIFNVEKAASSFTDFDGRVRGVLNPPRILGLSFEGRF